jgi:hypothetical protein
LVQRLGRSELHRGRRHLRCRVMRRPRDVRRPGQRECLGRG